MRDSNKKFPSRTSCGGRPICTRAVSTCVQWLPYSFLPRYERIRCCTRLHPHFRVAPQTNRTGREVPEESLERYHTVVLVVDVLVHRNECSNSKYGVNGQIPPELIDRVGFAFILPARGNTAIKYEYGVGCHGPPHIPP